MPLQSIDQKRLLGAQIKLLTPQHRRWTIVEDDQMNRIAFYDELQKRPVIAQVRTVLTESYVSEAVLPSGNGGRNSPPSC